jgi:hypothetical protein
LLHLHTCTPAHLHASAILKRELVTAKYDKTLYSQ